MQNPEKEAARLCKMLTSLAAKYREAEGNLEAFKKRKAGLVLKAHGNGNEAARDKLAVLNRQAASASLEVDDINLAISQANDELEAARQVMAEAAEAERLKNLSAACEAIVKAAEAVDEKGKAMMQGVAAYITAFDIARQFVDGQDHAAVNRLDARRHLHICLGELTGLQRNPLDPRSGKGLAELDRATLSHFMLNDAGIKQRAAMKSATSTSNVVDLEQTKAASAA